MAMEEIAVVADEAGLVGALREGFRCDGSDR
jgi:hypothetical protein